MVQLAVVSLIDDSPASEDGVVVVGRYPSTSKTLSSSCATSPLKLREVKAFTFDETIGAGDPSAPPGRQAVAAGQSARSRQSCSWLDDIEERMARSRL